MSYDGWIEFNGVEFINVARTAKLAQTIGLDTVRIRDEIVTALERRFVGYGFGGFGLVPFGLLPTGGPDYLDLADITTAPWYDAGFPASAEFAGIVPLAFNGLDDSTLTSSPVEYITDGGFSGKPRNATLSIVASVALVATTERGAEYGKRWMDRVLRRCAPGIFCSGSEMRYLRYADDDAPIVHRRDVRLTRGSSVTRKKVSRCSSTWLATFTLNAADPFEYGEPMDQIATLGEFEALGSQVTSSGYLDLVEETCPVYDYTPIYDPLYPALVPGPAVPNFLPDGWGIEDGMVFRRVWARISPVEPVDLNVVPMLTLTSTVEARMVRVSIWPSDADTDSLCGALFTAIVFYLPPSLTFYLDGEQKAAYAWDGSGLAVRRTDSLVYGSSASPVQWTAFNDLAGMLVTLDTFAVETGGFQGGGHVRAGLQFVAKSD